MMATVSMPNDTTGPRDVLLCDTMHLECPWTGPVCRPMVVYSVSLATEHIAVQQELTTNLIGMQTAQAGRASRL